MLFITIIFTIIKYTKLYVHVVNLSAKDNQKLSEPLSSLAKCLNNQFIERNIKQKVNTKTLQAKSNSIQPL